MKTFFRVKKIKIGAAGRHGRMHRPLTNPATTALLPPPSLSHCRSPARRPEEVPSHPLRIGEREELGPAPPHSPNRHATNRSPQSPAAGPPPVASRRCHPIPFAAANRHYRAQREMRLPCITPLRIWREEHPRHPPRRARRHHQIHRPHLGVAAAGHRHHRPLCRCRWTRCWWEGGEGGGG